MQNKIILLVAIFFLTGCAGSVQRKVNISVLCEKCVTPYGKGDKLQIKIEKELDIDRRNPKSN